MYDRSFLSTVPPGPPWRSETLSNSLITWLIMSRAAVDAKERMKPLKGDGEFPSLQKLVKSSDNYMRSLFKPSDPTRGGVHVLTYEIALISTI